MCTHEENQLRADRPNRPVVDRTYNGRGNGGGSVTSHETNVPIFGTDRDLGAAFAFLSRDA